ncbi:hypothetical protein QYM36_018264 [Artemia franciscana]|uniref:Uncharacterized protein n=1 Tax=Artemia franciscana TaxID=6661 RepID=A0AA88HDA3_ARTSF|nr:hypothetical protein QYM36_018264 [Artemia franciscana]
MLQRNVNVEEGLVNGSMGYVKGFKMTAANIATALVDAGDRCFGPGMIYVALSHVTMSEGLHLLDRRKICVDTEALVEYNRLRQKYRPDLPQFAIPEPFKVPTVPVAKQQPVKRKPSSSTSIDVPPKKSKPDAAKDKPKTNSTPARKVKPTTSEGKKKAPTKRLNAEAVETSFPTKKTQHDTAVKQNYRSGIGPGIKGLKNTDGSACYANATMQAFLPCTTSSDLDDDEIIDESAEVSSVPSVTIVQSSEQVVVKPFIQKRPQPFTRLQRPSLPRRINDSPLRQRQHQPTPDSLLSESDSDYYDESDDEIVDNFKENKLEKVKIVNGRYPSEKKYNLGLLIISSDNSALTVNRTISSTTIYYLEIHCHAAINDK